jgi:two-component system, NtrC family, nitrogen regulation sensor histidine kinase NtrY
MSEDKNTEIKRRKPPWILGGIVLALLTVLLLLQPSNVWKVIDVDSASETLILYALSSLNFIAFIIFGFILIRSLLKLRQERRTLQLGAKIKTRLLVYFAGVSILPLIAMAFFSYNFMNRAVERWFSQIPENVIRKAKDVRSKTNEEQIEKLRKTAPVLANALEGKEIADADLQKIVAAGNFLRLEVRGSDDRTIASAERENISSEQKALIGEEFEKAARKDFVNPTGVTEETELDVTKAELADGRTLLLAMNLPDGGEIEQIALNSLVELDELKSGDYFVRQLGITTLGLLTFLLIFASSWMAFHIGKNLTRPIRALAVGADEIARGNLAYRVDTFAEDELELLVRAFNEMSAKLEENSAELRERRKYIETVLQSLSTGVISFDPTNRVTTINKAARRMFKLEDADFSGVELELLVSRENKPVLEKLINRAKRTGQAAEQTVLQRENGSSETTENLPVALTASALPDGGGSVLVIEDLSELITAQRASAWQEVARRMAHEIKNPLTPIQLSAERIAKNFYRNSSFVLRPSSFAESSGNIENSESNGEGQRTNDEGLKTNKQLEKIVNESTETILREVSSLKSMVDEFSRFARLPNAKLSEGDVNEIVRQAVLLYEDRIDDVEIKCELAETLPKTQIDAEQLKRVFVNLIDNSYEAFEKTADDKRIFVKTFHDPARDLIVAEFSDTGKGINPRDFQRLFQPYFSTKGRGTGLGLAIVQRIISEHGGRIKVVANNPKGAKFIVELPVNV